LYEYLDSEGTSFTSSITYFPEEKKRKKERKKERRKEGRNGKENYG
jgi:hypothetical protein